jgi:hypothetical protein
MVTPTSVGSIFNVFESIPRLDAEENMCADKKLLIDPRPICGSELPYLDRENPEAGVSNGAEPAPKFYYTCTTIPHCSYVSSRCGILHPFSFVNRQIYAESNYSNFMGFCTVVSFDLFLRSGTKCPRHQRKMTMPCQLIDDHETAKNSAPDGYVKNGNKFFVTDNLEIFPSSKSLILLKRLKVENMSFVDSLDIHIGTDASSCATARWGRGRRSRRSL